MGASIVGFPKSLTQEGESKPTIHIVNERKVMATSQVLEVGDVVIAKVLKLFPKQVSVAIVAVGDNPLREDVAGIIRKEDVLAVDLDSIVVHEIFQSGQVVRAAVLSKGDS